MEYNVTFSGPDLYQIIIYMRDESQIHDDNLKDHWYVQYIYTEEEVNDDEYPNFHYIVYPYTYKCILYEMRTPDVYIGVIPSDILDEVIKYL
jgi:hypothetical protein